MLNSQRPKESAKGFRVVITERALQSMARATAHFVGLALLAMASEVFGSFLKVADDSEVIGAVIAKTMEDSQVAMVPDMSKM